MMRRGVGLDVSPLYGDGDGNAYHQMQLREMCCALRPWWAYHAREIKEFGVRANAPLFFLQFAWTPEHCLCLGSPDAPLVLDATPDALETWFRDLETWMRVCFGAAELVQRAPMSRAAVLTRLRASARDGCARIVAVARLAARQYLIPLECTWDTHVESYTWPSGMPTFAEALFTQWIDPALSDLHKRATGRVHVHQRLTR